MFYGTRGELYVCTILIVYTCGALPSWSKATAQTVKYFLERGRDMQSHIAVSQTADLFGLTNTGGTDCHGTETRDWCHARNALDAAFRNTPCACRCPPNSRTYLHGYGECLQDKRVRAMLGDCGFYANTENSSSPLTVLNIRSGPGSIWFDSSIAGCSVDTHSSRYYDNGHWSSLPINVPVHFSVFRLYKNVYYIWWTGQDINEFYSGRIIRLNMSCPSNSRIPPDKSCFLFKAAGKLFYNYTAPRPTPSSVTLTQTSPSVISTTTTSSPRVTAPLSSMTPVASPSPTPVLSISKTMSLTSTIAIAPSGAVSPSRVVTSRPSVVISSNIPTLPTSVKAKGDPETQTSIPMSIIIGSAVASVLVLVVSVVLIYCRCTHSSRTGNKTDKGMANPTYCRGSEPDIILKNYPLQPKRKPGKAANGDCEYASIDNHSDYKVLSPVYESLENKTRPDSMESVYHGLRHTPVTRGQADPVYKSLEFRDSGSTSSNRGTTCSSERDYQSLHGLEDSHEYGTLGRQATPPSRDSLLGNQSLYNTLENPDLDNGSLSFDYEVSWRDEPTYLKIENENEVVCIQNRENEYLRPNESDINDTKDSDYQTLEYSKRDLPAVPLNARLTEQGTEQPRESLKGASSPPLYEHLCVNAPDVEVYQSLGNSTN